MHDFVMEQIRTLTDLPVKLVVVTHNHADHSGGAAQMQALGATAIVSAADRENMARDGVTNLPQVAYTGQTQVYLGGKEVQLREFRGHTRGDTVAYLPAARVVAVGDLLTTVDSIPVIVNYGDGGSWSDLGRSLDEIAKMDFDYLIGGHGPMLTKQEFLVLRDKLASIRERFRELNRAEASQEEIAATLMAEFNWGGPATRNIPGMLQELR
jgi:glyoxylase-like metal-dependent hydrolase (beta-lactamase superfamily II)